MPLSAKKTPTTLKPIPAPVAEVPNLPTLQAVTNDLAKYALFAALAAILVSASMWGIGTKQGNEQQTFNGKRGAIAGVLAAFLIGMAPLLINWFVELGTEFAT